MLETLNTVEIRHIEAGTLRVILIGSTKSGTTLSRDFMLAVNTALYEDRRGGQYAHLVTDEEFMLALDWHNTQHEI